MQSCGVWVWNTKLPPPWSPAASAGSLLLVAVLWTATRAPADVVVNETVVELPLFQLIVAVPALVPPPHEIPEPVADPDALIEPDVSVESEDAQFERVPVNV